MSFFETDERRKVVLLRKALDDFEKAISTRDLINYEEELVNNHLSDAITQLSLLKNNYH